jgi:hypothetical protein
MKTANRKLIVGDIGDPLMTGFSCGLSLQDDKTAAAATTVATIRVFRAAFKPEFIVLIYSSARRILPNQRREEIVGVFVQ